MGCQQGRVIPQDKKEGDPCIRPLISAGNPHALADDQTPTPIPAAAIFLTLALRALYLLPLFHRLSLSTLWRCIVPVTATLSPTDGHWLAMFLKPEMRGAKPAYVQIATRPSICTRLGSEAIHGSSEDSSEAIEAGSGTAHEQACLCLCEV